MAAIELDDEFAVMMELHCLEYRKRYGHLRTDGLDWEAPINNTNRHLPGFLTLKASHDVGLRFWLECEKALSARRGAKHDTLPDMVVVGCDPGRYPIFAASRFARPRIDRSAHSSPAPVLQTSRISIILNGLYKQFETWPMREVIDRDSAFVACRTSTDYPKRKGWLPIPHRVENPASPSSRLLALLARS